MKRTAAAAIVIGLFVGALSTSVRAQLAVFDPANYIEAILQVDQLVNQYEQMIKQYDFLVRQARRLPNMAGRYVRFTPGWPPHDLGSVFYAGPLLSGLNDGDPSGAGYLSMAHHRDSFPDVAWR